MARRVLMAEVSVGRVRGRPRLGWIDGVMDGHSSYGQQRNDGGAMREISEKVESLGT